VETVVKSIGRKIYSTAWKPASLHYTSTNPQRELA